MISRALLPILFLLLFSSGLLGFHFFINYSLLNDPINQKAFFDIHLFLFFCSFIVILITLRIKKLNADWAGLSYLAFSVLKMFVCVLFLWPWIAEKTPASKLIVYHFFALFFPYLIIETVLTLRFVIGNSPSSSH